MRRALELAPDPCLILQVCVSMAMLACNTLRLQVNVRTAMLLGSSLRLQVNVGMVMLATQ